MISISAPNAELHVSRKGKRNMLCSSKMSLKFPGG